MTFKNQFVLYLNLLVTTISSDMLSYAFVMVSFCLLLLTPEIIPNFDYLLLQIPSKLKFLFKNVSELFLFMQEHSLMQLELNFF